MARAWEPGIFLQAWFEPSWAPLHGVAFLVEHHVRRGEHAAAAARPPRPPASIPGAGTWGARLRAGVRGPPLRLAPWRPSASPGGPRDAVLRRDAPDRQSGGRIRRRAIARASAVRCAACVPAEGA